MSIYWKTPEPVTLLRYATLADLCRVKSGDTSSLRRIFLDNLACAVVRLQDGTEEVCHLKHLRADKGLREIADALEICALRLATQHLPRCSPDFRDDSRWIYLDETTWWSVSGEAMIRLGRLLARGDLHVKDPIVAWLEDERLALERVPLGSLKATTPFRHNVAAELSPEDLYAKCQPTPTPHTNLPRDIYATCARAFNTTPEDAKERLLAAMYGGTPSEMHSRAEDISPTETLRKFQAAVDLLRGLNTQLSLYVAGGTLCLMSGPSHDEGGRPLRDNIIALAGGLRISGGDW